MQRARSGETEIHNQPHDQHRRAEDRQHRNGHDWNHEFWNVVVRLPVIGVFILVGINDDAVSAVKLFLQLLVNSVGQIS